MPENQDDAMFSRPPNSSALGKLNSKMDITMSEELKEALIGLAFSCGEHGIPPTEYARRVLERHVFGAAFMLRRVGQDDIAGHQRNPR